MLRTIFIMGVMLPLSCKAADIASVAKQTKDVIPSVANLPGYKQIPVLCAALTVYHEARGVDKMHQQLAASLIYTRAEKANSSTCKVLRKAGQFPWTRESVRNLIPKEKEAWEKAQAVAVEKRNNFTHVEYTSSRKAFRRKPGMTIVSLTKDIVFYNWKPKSKHT